MTETNVGAESISAPLLYALLYDLLYTPRRRKIPVEITRVLWYSGAENLMRKRGIPMGCDCFEGKAQKFADPAIDISKLEPTLEKYAGAAGSLITILQKAQELYGYLPVDLLAYIAQKSGVKPAKVMGVVSFYTQFRTKPVGKHLILLCQGTACHVNGSAEIEAAIREYLGVAAGEITANGLFTYNNVACLGCCSLSPVMMIGERTYGKLTKDSAVKILREIARGEAAK